MTQHIVRSHQHINQVYTDSRRTTHGGASLAKPIYVTHWINIDLGQIAAKFIFSDAINRLALGLTDI